jgi:hypothetical protein
LVELTEEVDDDAAVGEAAGGVVEVSAALGRHDPYAADRRHAAGVRVRVAEVEQHHRRPPPPLLLPGGRCCRGSRRARAALSGAAGVAPRGGGGHGAQVLPDGDHGRRRRECQRQHHDGHHRRSQHAEVLQREADHLAAVGGARHGGLFEQQVLDISLSALRDSTTAEKYTRCV